MRTSLPLLLWTAACTSVAPTPTFGPASSTPGPGSGSQGPGQGGQNDNPPIVAPATCSHTATPGALDPSFGAGGIVLGPSGDGTSVAVQPDGKVLVGSTAQGTGAVLVRFAPDGTLDAAFGTGGVVHEPAITIEAVAVAEDGKILASGTRSPDDDDSLVVVRYTTSGVRDTTFGDGGVAEATRAPNESHSVGGGSIAQRPDGKIFAMHGYANPVVARFDANGTLDASYGDQGRVHVGLAFGPLGLDGLGGVLVGATDDIASDETPSLRQFAPDGASFTKLPARQLLDVGPNGRIFAETTNGVAAFLPDGSVDTSFGAGGTIAINLGLRSPKVDVEGRFVAIVDTSESSAATTQVVARMTPGGAADATFGSGGTTAGRVGGGGGAFPMQALALDASCKIVVVGGAPGSDPLGVESVITVARYLP